MARSTSIAKAQILSYLAGSPWGGNTSAAISKATGLEPNSLFPALTALENDKLITSLWMDSPPPGRTIHSLTAAGRQQVGAMQSAQAPPPAGSGNWFWRKFVAPLFGG